MLRPEDLSVVVCPDCHGSLVFHGRSREDRLWDGALRCAACAAEWPVREGTPRLYREERVRGIDRTMRFLYGTFARLYDPFVEAAFAGLDVLTAGEARRFYLARLGLAARAASASRPLRVLEVGIGTGADLPFLRELETGPLRLEVWGIDLSLPMLALLDRRLEAAGDNNTRSIAADAHALPFASGSFDAVLQIGAVNACRDPRRVIAEMARVGAPGARVVLVDEQLDTRSPQALLHRAFFRAVTFYDRSPRAPTEHLPPGARDVTVEQMSRYFYCLTFGCPAPP